MQNFSISTLWSQAWAAFKRNWISGIGLIILVGVTSLIPILGSFINPFLQSVIFIISLFLQSVIFQWGLRAYGSEEPISFGSAFPSKFGTYLKVIIGLFVIDFVPLIVFGIGYVTLLSSMGSMNYGSDPSPMSFLFFIIGALLLLAVRILFFSYPYWVVDKDLGIGSSLSKAYNFSSRNLGKVIVFLLSALGINILGALPCFLGLFVTIPMTWIAGAGLYKALASSVDS